MTVFELMAKINLDSAGFDKGISGVKKGFSTLGKVGTAVASSAVVATTAMSGALLKTASDTADYGDKVDKMSQKMGLSAQAYQEWDAIMQHSGTSIDSMKASMKTLANAVENNNGAFERLGITQEELANMNQEEIFAKTISSLQNVKDDTERTYLAGQLLGRGATELGALLNMSSEETEAMRQKVHDLGGVMSDEAVKASARYKDSLQDMKTAFEGLKRNMGSEFLPALSDVMDGLGEVFSGSSTGLEKIDKGVQTAVDKLSDTVPKFLEIGGKIISSVGQAIINNAPKLFDAGLKMVGTLATGILDNSEKIINTGFELVKKLVSTLSNNAGKFIKAGAKAVINIGKGIAKNAPTIISELTKGLKNALSEISNHLGEFLDAGMNILDSLLNGFIDALPDIVSSITQFAVKFVTELGKKAPDIIEGGFKLFINLGESIIKAIPEILKSIPALIEGIGNGLTQGIITLGEELFELTTGMEHPFKTFKENVQKTIDEANNYASKLNDIQPKVVDYQNMISGVGNTWGDIKSDIDQYTKDINKIIGDAIKSKEGLNNSDLTKIGEYNKKLQEKYAEQLEITRSAQIANLQMVRSDLSKMTLENASQYNKDAEYTLQQSNEMTKQWWQSEITRIQNLNKARGTTGTELERQELSQAEAQYRAKVEENQKFYDDTIKLINQRTQELSQASQDTVTEVSGMIAKLNQEVTDSGTLTGMAMSALGVDTQAKGQVIKDELAKLDWATVEAYMDMIANQRANGATLTKEQHDFVDGMLNILENMPEGTKDLYEDAFANMAQIMDDDMPGIASKWAQGTDSFVQAVRTGFGISERSDSYRASKSNRLYKTTKASTDSMDEALKDSRNGLHNRSRTLSDTVDTAFRPLSGQMGERGKQASTGFWLSFYKEFGEQSKNLAETVESVAGTSAEVLDEHSPSRVMERIGRFAGEGFGIGWSNAMDEVLAGIEDDFAFASATVSPEFISDNVIEAESGFNYEALRDIMIEAMDGMTWEADDREVARLVRKYA